MLIRTAALYLIARCEVAWAQWSGALRRRVAPGPDCLPLELIPSQAAGTAGDRVLAEFDQDGFLFASDTRDECVFNRRTHRTARLNHRLRVVLVDGAVCVEKVPIYTRRNGLKYRILESLAFGFYVEAAALVRLRDLACVPQLRGIDVRNRMIRMEYIWGDDLRRYIPDGSPRRNDISSWEVPDDREAGAAAMKVLTDVAQRGVAHLDIHPANFIRGRRSG